MRVVHNPWGLARQSLALYKCAWQSLALCMAIPGARSDTNSGASQGPSYCSCGVLLQVPILDTRTRSQIPTHISVVGSVWYGVVVIHTSARVRGWRNQFLPADSINPLHAPTKSLLSHACDCMLVTIITLLDTQNNSSHPWSRIIFTKHAKFLYL